MPNKSIIALAVKDYKEGNATIQSLSDKYKVSKYFIRKNVMPLVSDESRYILAKKAAEKAKENKGSYIAQYDMNGAFVAHWASFAALSLSGFDAAKIKSALFRDTHNSQGYKWFRKFD